MKPRSVLLRVQIVKMFQAHISPSTHSNTKQTERGTIPQAITKSLFLTKHEVSLVKSLPSTIAVGSTKSIP